MKFITVLILLLNQIVFAETKLQKWLVDLEKCNGSVAFKAIGRPSALKINGKGEKAKGTLIIDGVVITGTTSFNLDSLDTGITLRNTHMKKKYLDTEKYPSAKFVFTSMTLPGSFASNKHTSSIWISKLQ
ncbi:MAG: YceI family protein [Deltaproteobacteria bacterium]|nr:YceI family protein [Deltaproteobacteria bacterium]